MLLTRKLTLAIAVGVAVVLGLSGYLQTRREALLFNRDNARDHHAVSYTHLTLPTKRIV